MKVHPKLLAAVAALAALAAAPAAQADVTGSTLVTGTATPGLAIIAATPAAFATFAPGTNTTTPSLITVTNSDTNSPNWVLHATDSVSTAGAGQMSLVSNLLQCANAPARLTNPLKVLVDPLGAGHPGITVLNNADTAGVALGALSAATAAGSRIASGSGLTAAFPVGFSQTIGSETINAGCSYTETVTFTASAT
jgi:opacity protein-like surface antigen